jgi:hypothetical protein
MAIFAASRNHCILISYRYKYTLFTSLILSITANAQTAGQLPEEDAYEGTDTLYAVVNAVKFDPVQVFFGDFQFYFEKMIANRMSVELGFGPTRRNYAASLFDDELDAYGRNVDIKTRYAATLGVRRYFADTGELYGSYLSLAMVYRQYEKEYQVIDQNDEIVPGYSFTDRREYASALVVYGYQALSARSNVFADFYIGIGLRYKSLQIVDTYDVHDPNAYSISNESGFGPAVQVGAKIGFGF